MGWSLVCIHISFSKDSQSKASPFSGPPGTGFPKVWSQHVLLGWVSS